MNNGSITERIAEKTNTPFNGDNGVLDHLQNILHWDIQQFLLKVKLNVVLQKKFSHKVFFFFLFE